VIRLLVIGLLLYIGYRIVISLASAKKPQAKPGEGCGSAGVEAHRDPICGVYVSEDDAVVGKLDGQRHYFCSMKCLEKFREKLDHTSAS
jgi:YHS domain-containing protein